MNENEVSNLSDLYKQLHEQSKSNNRKIKKSTSKKKSKSAAAAYFSTTNNELNKLDTKKLANDVKIIIEKLIIPKNDMIEIFDESRLDSLQRKSSLSSPRKPVNSSKLVTSSSLNLKTTVNFQCKKNSGISDDMLNEKFKTSSSFIKKRNAKSFKIL